MKWGRRLSNRALILILVAGGLFLACSRESDRTIVDFNQKIDLKAVTKWKPEAALKVAVASMISPDEGFVRYRRLLDYLEAGINIRIHLIQRKTYAEINDLLGSGAIDLAFICAGLYVSGKDRYHFEALAIPLVHQEPVHRAFLITGQASSIDRFKDLRGRVFAFSDPDSATGCLVARFLLSEIGERPETFFGKTIYTYGHDNSILAVSRSLADGAFVHEHIWKYYSQKRPTAASRVRVIYASEQFGNPPLIASATIPKVLKERIRERLLGLHQDPQGRGILREMLIDRFIPPVDHLYDPIRRMFSQTRLLENGHASTSQP